MNENGENSHLEDQFISALNSYSHILKSTKQKHFLTIMENNAGNQQKLFRAMDKVMHRSTKQSLPEHTDSKSLANVFCDFFQEKVNKIRNNLEDISQDTFKYDSQSSCNFPAFNSFRNLTEEEVRKIIAKSASKSCELDPLPTTLLKLFIDEVCPIITSIVNKSLSTAEMPTIFKKAIIRPLIKKPSLDPVLNNYRPVSNFAYISKVIEEAASLKIAEHIEKNSLADPLQSAYKPKNQLRPHCLKFVTIF